MTQNRNYLLWQTIVVPETERVLMTRNGRFETILLPGRHRYWTGVDRIDTEVHSLTWPYFVSEYDKALFRERGDLASRHLVELRTGPEEMAVIYLDGKLFGVQEPDSRTVLWADAGPFEFQHFDATKSLEVPAELAGRIVAAGASNGVKRFNVEHGQTGLLYIDNVLERELAPGVHTFWNAGRQVAVKLIDMREHVLDVGGQEILTRDRVSIRVNLAAKYRVRDARKAVTVCKDFAEALYRALQHAFRVSLGTKTLDEILANKVAVDAEAAETVRAQMAEAGVEVGDIAVKDVILPGDMRDILNRVVQAEKEAEANIIRRREETAATRALLNTARVMQDNPVMLRLKELEALEAIADKVQTLTVHNGTRGLLEDIVSMRGNGEAAVE